MPVLGFDSVDAVNNTIKYSGLKLYLIDGNFDTVWAIYFKTYI